MSADGGTAKGRRANPREGDQMKKCLSGMAVLAAGLVSTAGMAGTLDESTGLEAVEHIFTGDKGNYYELTDGLPTRHGARCGSA